MCIPRLHCRLAAIQSSISVFPRSIHATSRLTSGRAMHATNRPELEQRGTETNTGDSTDTRDLRETSDVLDREAECRCAKFAL
jgi:hypothetical protein